MTKAYHLVGVGGAGMSGLARILLARGCAVSGSDRKDSAALERLRRAGAQIALRQDAATLPPDAEVVVASLAIAEDHPELAAARARGLPVQRYPQAAADLMRGRRGLCVAGAHGKTTVTAALAFVLRRAGCDPSFIIGGDAPQLGGNASHGQGEWFVLEACEYQRAFLAYQPETALITNVDLEHLDYYRGEEDIVDAFAAFARRVRSQLVVCADSPLALRAAERAACSVVTYGFSERAEWRPRVARRGRGQVFALERAGESLGEFRIQLPGLHNVVNAAGVAACASAVGVELDAAREALAEFRGAARRFERYGERAGVEIVDDFAHHPAEIRALLAAAREAFPGRRMVAVFQPHQFSRTRIFLDEFAEALRAADEVAVAPIYAARDTEADRSAVSEADLAARVRARGGRAEACESFDEIQNRLADLLRPGDVLLTIGAGDVWKIAKGMVRRLGEHPQV